MVSGKSFDITLLTDSRLMEESPADPYIRNVLLEDGLVMNALEKREWKVRRVNWDHPGVEWNDTRYILFRSTWDYFDRFSEFEPWLAKVGQQTGMINPYELIRWNLDKHYLQELSGKGIPIPPTRFAEPGDSRRLTDLVKETDWEEVILKPVISGAARHTYRFRAEEAAAYERIFRQLIECESMMLQEFQVPVLTRGELAMMVFDGQYSHAVLKKAKEGDFRVQDDFGGTVHEYNPSQEEIRFAEEVVSCCHPRPLYARVDAIPDMNHRWVVSELELIEPELWFRFRPEAADLLAAAILRHDLHSTPP